jgi:antitoxin component of MazEF toxin-antitoxin module
MIKHLQKIGNSRGIVLDKPILDLLGVKPEGSFELLPQKGGLFLKPIDAKQAYKKIAKKHRKSLDKLASNI